MFDVIRCRVVDAGIVARVVQGMDGWLVESPIHFDAINRYWGGRSAKPAFALSPLVKLRRNIYEVNRVN
jgi:hypothetical protein